MSRCRFVLEFTRKCQKISKIHFVHPDRRHKSEPDKKKKKSKNPDARSKNPKEDTVVIPPPPMIKNKADKNIPKPTPQRIPLLDKDDENSHPIPDHPRLHIQASQNSIDTLDEILYNAETEK